MSTTSLKFHELHMCTTTPHLKYTHIFMLLNRYPGVITACNEDGTYNIQYDDGDTEDNKPAGRIAVPPAE